MSYIGDYVEDYATLNFKFTTVKDTGVPTVLAGTPVVSVYAANGLTQITAGITLTVDFDGVTGLNHVLIDLSADAAYLIGQDYQVVITAGTVNALSVVGYVVGEFSIENRFQEVDLVKLGGIAQSATDLKDFADAGYDPVTNKVQGVVTVDTTITNIDMRGTNSAALATTIGTPTNTDIATDLVDIQSTIGSIGASSGGAIPFSAVGDNTAAPIKGVTFSGTVIGGTFTTTSTNSTTYHNVSDPTLIDIVYKYNLGGSKQAVQLNFTGFLNSSNDTCTVQLYDFIAAAWETVGTINGQNQTTNISATVIPFAKHTGTGTDLGDVLIRFTCSASSPDLFVGILITDAIAVIDSVGYAGMISINTIGGGQAGTNPQINGTIDNPIISISDMDSLLIAKNFTRVDVQGNSSLTLTTAQISRIFTGFNWALAFGGQDITNSYFGNAIIGGVATSTSGVIVFERCRFNSCTLPPMMARECGFLAGAVITAGRGGTYTWFEGHNMETFTGSVIFDFNRVVNTASVVKMQWKPGFGTVTVRNLKATDECSIYGDARIIIDVTCTQGGLINAHNSTVIDNVVGGFAGTLVKGDIVTKLESLDTTKIPNVISLANINAEADTALADYDAPTNAEMNARTLPTASYFDPAVDTVTNVTNLATNNDKTGYSILGTKQTLDALNDLSTIQVNTEVDNALNTVIPGSPTVNSINERVKTLATVATEARLAELDPANLPTDILNVKADTVAILTDTNAIDLLTKAGGSGDLAAIKLKTDTIIVSGIKKNTAFTGFSFFMADISDHVTGKTGLTITSTKSINGVAFTSTTNSATEIGNGNYRIDLSAADLNGNGILLKFNGGATADVTEMYIIPSQ